MRSVRLVFAIVLLSVGWATGGGAAQILFPLFGEVVFNASAAGIGVIWGCAGLGLLLGAVLANRFGSSLSFRDYKVVVFVDYIVHGAAYVLFAQMRRFELALVFIMLSRSVIAINSIGVVAGILSSTTAVFWGWAN